MTFVFKPAVREQTSVMIGLAGPSSSGKTFSALRLAKGLADGGPVAVIDTESRRALHYADQFDFQYAELTAPFRPSRYLEAIEAAKASGAKVIIVDSMSHEHEGPGGLLEWQEEELTRMAGQDFAKRERVKFTAWIKPKRDHNRFVNSVLQLNAHIIFCFRAKEKLKMTRANGKTEVVSIGWQPICSDRFEYEMTSLLMLPPNGQGIPDLSAQATKLQEQHKPFVGEGKQIGEDMGRQFGSWADGGAKAQPRNEVDPYALAVAAAQGGKEAFTAWWNGPGKRHRAAVADRKADLKAIVDAAETGQAVDDENPFDQPAAETPDEPPPHDADGVIAEPAADAPHLSAADFLDALNDLAAKAEEGESHLNVFLASRGAKFSFDAMNEKQRAEWNKAVSEALA